MFGRRLRQTLVEIKAVGVWYCIIARTNRFNRWGWLRCAVGRIKWWIYTDLILVLPFNVSLFISVNYLFVNIYVCPKLQIFTFYTNTIDWSDMIVKMAKQFVQNKRLKKTRHNLHLLLFNDGVYGITQLLIKKCKKIKSCFLANSIELCNSAYSIVLFNLKITYNY